MMDNLPKNNLLVANCGTQHDATIPFHSNNYENTDQPRLWTQN